MTRLEGIHVRLYRWFTAFLPRDHRRRHGEEQVQLFADLMSTGHRPWRLWTAAGPDFCSVLFSSCRAGRTVSPLARIALFPLSTLNATVGILLVVIAVGSDAVPLWVAAPAAGVVVQGSYTYAWLLGRSGLRTHAADNLFLMGEVAGLALGVVGVVAATVRHSGANDTEYGPVTILSLVAVHALFGILAALRQPTPGATTTT
jgi:hypothetical protein